MIKYRLFHIAILLAIGLFSYSTKAEEFHFTPGEVAMFGGVFCADLESAKNILFSKTEDEMVKRYNEEKKCAIFDAPITVVGLMMIAQIDDNVFNLISVNTFAKRLYILTTIKVKSKNEDI